MTTQGDIGMDQQDSVGTVDQSTGTTVDLGPSEGSYAGEAMREGFPDLAEGISERFRLRLGRVLVSIESVIQRYPWPTVLLGIGVGYLVARRMPRMR
jgi:hypothetical protein